LSSHRSFAVSSVRVAALSLILMFGLAGSASATSGHRFSGQFGAGQLAGPAGVAVDPSSGDVFVADAYNGVIGVFNAAGDFQRQWGGAATPYGFLSTPWLVATDGTSVYVADVNNNAVERFDTAGNYLDQLNGASTTVGSFATPYGVAIDPANGDVYVANTGNNVIDRFDSSGAFVSEFGSGELAAPTYLAVDSAHRVYVTDSGNGRVVRYSAGVLGATIDSSAPAAVAVNAADDHVFVADSGPGGIQVSEFATDGSLVSNFGAGRIANATGMAVNATTGRVYVSDLNVGAVLSFNQITLPTVTTTAGATAISSSGATIAGTVDPEGVAGTRSHFEYGIDTNYGGVSADFDPGSGSAPVATSEPLSGLAPGTTYHFRLVGSNPQGSLAGPDRTFTTDPVQVAVDVDGAPFGSAMTTTTATLNGTLNPNGAATTYHFEYGPTNTYGTSTPDGNAGSTPGSTPVNAPLTGLAAGTTYHFRLVADNGVGGSVNGADATFTTAPAQLPSASNVTSIAATLNATVIGPGRYHFEYGADTSYGTNTPEKTVTTSGPTAATASTLPLTPNTTYHFRVVLITSNEQTVTSQDATLTTVALAGVTTNTVTAVTPTTATLNATVDTHGVAGTAAFAITDAASAYGTTTAGVALAAVDGPQSVAVPVTGLPAGSALVVRASATVAGSTAWGDPAVLDTPALPPFTPPAPSPPISATPYGCTAPHLNAVDTRPKPGTTVTVTGTDLGLGGTIALGSATVQPTGWTATAFTFTVPDDATGALPLTVNCGTASNTIGLTVYSEPSNEFTITKTTVKGSAATLSVKVPGPGTIQTSASNTAAGKATVTKATTGKVTVRLSKAGKKALAKAKSKKLKVAVRVKYTPAGGTAATTTKTVTFKR
jgi:hypothetical protein